MTSYENLIYHTLVDIAETKTAPLKFVDVSSHDARGEIYRANPMRHYKDPNVLGVTYCACLLDQGGNTLLKGNQNGYHPKRARITSVQIS